MIQTKQFRLLACAATVMAFVMLASGCTKEDEPAPAPIAGKQYDSLITEFRNPDQLMYVRTDFNVGFLYNNDSSRIEGCRLLDFKVRPLGTIINNESDSEEFNRLLRSFADTIAPDKLPMEAWDYRPLSKAITKIDIVPTLTDLLPDAAMGVECNRYFDISYVSWYDFIRNGYSWEGVENPGPVYRVPLTQFNKMPEKHLVDADRLVFHLSPAVADNYTHPRILDDCFEFDVTVHFADGKSISKRFVVVQQTLSLEIYNYISWYNRPRPGRP